MVTIAATDVKLIPHRWAMHAIKALAQRDAALLRRVFTELSNLPHAAIDTKIQAFGCGAPLQFYDYGFFDSSAKGFGTALLDRVLPGDTLLLLALRQHDPDCARVLIECHASLEIRNDDHEQPMEMLYEAFAAFQLSQRRSPDETTRSIVLDAVLQRRLQYETLFAETRDRLEAHHKEIRAHVDAELERIYTKHAPERLVKIEQQMNDFEYRERELLLGVQRKYEA